MRYFINLIGQKFGKLIVNKYIGKTKRGKSRWECSCDCGNITIVRGDHLTSNRIKSCGCYRKSGKYAIKHGHTINGKISNIYRIWTSMIQRCNNPNDKGYKYYGARGIKVCKRWLKFENFLEDIGEIPKGLTLDRTNNNRGYGPKNWGLATVKQQIRNRRNSITVKINGVNKLLIEIAEEYNIPYKKLWKRIKIYKWPIEKAISKP